MDAQQVILDTIIKSVSRYDVGGRGRLAWVVVEASHIPFAVTISRRGARLLVDGVPIEGFELPHVSGAADALGSFGVFEANLPAAAKEGARLTVVVPGEAGRN